MAIVELLNEMRNHGGANWTTGLPDDVILSFAKTDQHLTEAIEDAHRLFLQLREDEPALLAMDEQSQIREVQSGYVNFYTDDAVSPFIPLAASGPWMVTLKGAVLHDSGGYGMIGFGHAPQAVLSQLARKQVMANVMTPSISQKNLTVSLRREIGHTQGACPFDRFLCLNSGSEAVSVASRISDINAKLMTDPGGRYAGKEIRILSLKGSFHGRTDRPGQFSDSTRRVYCKHLATFRDRDRLITVEPNDVQQLRQVFDWAESNRVFIEAFFFEPVMGEGNPGQAVNRDFYDTAMELTRKHGSLLLVDSIQAGLRAHGVLSIVDYPGFESVEPPDMEAYSKALNAGQYPLSVLAMTSRAANLYRKGIYGNTMTTNPRALDVACAVLDLLTPELRQNIRQRAEEFMVKLGALQEELGDRITGIQGTGLLLSTELDSKRYKSYGSGSTEEYMRLKGINVIHGGENSLRYTPHFNITSEEIDLLIDATRNALLNGPQKVSASEAEAA